MQIPDIRTLVMYGLAFLLAVTVHEYAHARAAVHAGDETPRLNGRMSLNPIDHLDPIGTVMFVITMLYGFGIAWGKPVPVNPYNFRNPRWDNLKVSLWGPLSNMLTAFLLSMIVRFHLLPIDVVFYQLLIICVTFNLTIAFFNLIPVPPLDGSHILSSLLPYEQARAYDAFVSRFALLILIGLLATGLAGIIIREPVYFFIRLFLG